MIAKNTMPTWAEINLDNLKNNLNNIKKIINEDTMICCVVKANAYGHGSVTISKYLENEKVDYFAVSRLEEALELRENNITTPILCLGYIPEEGLEIAIKNDIEITVYSLEVAKYLEQVAKRINKCANIHIKLDTGMSRIGFDCTLNSINEIYKIDNLEYINIKGIFTHFAVADEKDKEFTNIQVAKFERMVKELEYRDVIIPIKHVSNSAAVIDCPSFNFNMIRCGIILYGHYPSEDVMKDKLDLKQVMTLKTRVAHIKELKKNNGISYGLKYKTSDTEKIITIPIGYADGFTRMQNNPKVYIQGEEFEVVGRICMDQCMVKIDKNINIKIGDEVIIFGESENEISKISTDLNTIDYEVLCMVARRINRVYMERNAIAQVDSYLIK